MKKAFFCTFLLITFSDILTTTFSSRTVYVSLCDVGDQGSVNTAIFHGKDSSCITPKTTKMVAYHESESFHCDGQGKNRCKFAKRNDDGCEGAIRNGNSLLIFDKGGGNDFNDVLEVSGRQNCCGNVKSDAACRTYFNICEQRGYTGRQCYTAIINGWDGNNYIDSDDWARTVLKYQAMIDYKSPLKDTTWIGTHNSFANNKDSNFNSDWTNQPDSVKTQLRNGIRQLTFDVHYSMKNCVPSTQEIRVCHNNFIGSQMIDCTCCDAGSLCTGGATGSQRFGDVLNTIKDWLNEQDVRIGNKYNYETQVLMINLDLMYEIETHDNRIQKLEELISDRLSEYIYSPASYYTDFSFDQCYVLPYGLTKEQVLSSGPKKSIIMHTKSTKCEDQELNYILFNSGNDRIDDVKDPSDIDKTINRLYRIVDGATKGKHNKIKLHTGNINSYFNAGVNILESYGFEGGSDWSDGSNPAVSVIQMSNAVWSWTYMHPSTNPSYQCAALMYFNRFQSFDCSTLTGYRAACYNINDGTWMRTNSPTDYNNAQSKCQELGSSYMFKTPKNRLEQLALTENNWNVLVNYKRINGIWTADV